jgi:hypothetical protein
MWMKALAQLMRVQTLFVSLLFVRQGLGRHQRWQRPDEAVSLVRLDQCLLVPLTAHQRRAGPFLLKKSRIA